MINNKITYTAYIHKIKSLKPMQLKESLCKLLDSINEIDYLTNTDKIIYTVSCVSVGLNRLHSISKISLTYQYKNKFERIWDSIFSSINTNNINNKEVFDNLFDGIRRTQNVYIYSISEMEKVNKFLENFSKYPNPRLLHFVVSLKTLNSLSNSAEEVIINKIIYNTLGADAPILQYLAQYKNFNLQSLQKFNIDEVLICIKAITDLKEEYEN